MKRFIVPVLAGACLLIGVVALASTTSTKSSTKTTMHTYMISVPHTAEQCLATLDDFDASKALSKFEFGCKDGDHTAYAMVSAKDADAAKAMVPEKERDAAKVVMVAKFTPEQLKQLHASMK